MPIQKKILIFMICLFFVSMIGMMIDMMFVNHPMPAHCVCH